MCSLVDAHPDWKILNLDNVSLRNLIFSFLSPVQPIIENDSSWFVDLTYTELSVNKQINKGGLVDSQM